MLCLSSSLALLPQSKGNSAHLQTSHDDPSELDHEDWNRWLHDQPQSPAYTLQQTAGSVRLNMQLNVEDVTQQADIVNRLVHRIIGKQDSGI